jgi:hypothetical protein
VFELICEALGTALWITALALIEAEPGARNQLSFRLIFGMSSIMLIEFAVTGYLFTTLVAALYLPRTYRFSYPLLSGALYLIHSEIFFIGLGNRILDVHNLLIQIGGACITFALTLAGDYLRGSITLLGQRRGITLGALNRGHG